MKPILNLNDFKSIEVNARFDNSTSGWKMEKTDVVRVLEYGEQVFALEAPKRSCTEGHRLLVKVEVLDPENPRPLRFDFVGKVEGTRDGGEGMMRVDLSMTQYDSITWEKIRELLSKRQQEIFTFIKSVKGLGNEQIGS